MCLLTFAAHHVKPKGFEWIDVTIHFLSALWEWSFPGLGPITSRKLCRTCLATMTYTHQITLNARHLMMERCCRTRWHWSHCNAWPFLITIAPIITNSTNSFGNYRALQLPYKKFVVVYLFWLRWCLCICLSMESIYVWTCKDMWGWYLEDGCGHLGLFTLAEKSQKAYLHVRFTGMTSLYYVRISTGLSANIAKISILATSKT